MRTVVACVKANFVKQEAELCKDMERIKNTQKTSVAVIGSGYWGKYYNTPSSLWPCAKF
jgi:hypothetical protein